MKICKECKHFDGDSLCVRGRRQVGVDPVHGLEVHKYKVLRFAHYERKSILPWRCGKSGRHFESRGDK